MNLRITKLSSCLVSGATLACASSSPYALLRQASIKRKAAIESELQSLKENVVYKIVDIPKNRKVIGRHWVLRVKRGADGEMEKFKAQVVAKGYSEREGIDYNETFSTIVRFEIL